VDTTELSDRYNYFFSESQKNWILSQVNCGTMVLENGVLKLTQGGLKICDLLVVDLLSKR